MTDPLWKRNNEDDAEGSVPSPLRSDAEASGGSSRSGRGSSRSRDPSGSGSPSRFRQLSNPITMNGLVVRVYDKYQGTWTEERRKEVLAFGQKPSTAAGKRASRKFKGRAGKAVGQEITKLLKQSLLFTNMLVITSVRNDWPFSAFANLLDEMGSKMPVGEKK
ncbi:hypothetical protein BSLG_005133 [Batrachochytrium salamandrivorans]|nr:hypothetical protein BSLG_005133 [Batrachochytrium salamandrivorans]